ncbi:MAG: tetratricopeptide repeat protein [Pseudomonadota bacterium]
MKEHTMSYVTQEMDEISSSPSDFVRHAEAALCSPAALHDGNGGLSGIRFHRGAKRTPQSSAAFLSVMTLFTVLAVTVFGLIGSVQPARCQMDEDLREAVDSHNAGRPKEAVEIYSEVLENNPRSVEALNWRGMAYDDMGKLDEALADLNKAIQLNPSYADAYNNRGEVHRKKKMYRQALSDYNKAATLDKKFAEPHFNLALIYEQEKNNQKAVAELSQYLKLMPNAEDKKEIEAKIRELGASSRVEKPGRAAEAGKPPVRMAAKTGDQPAAKPGERPGPKPGERPAVKPGDRPAAKPGERPGAKPGSPRPGAKEGTAPPKKPEPGIGIPGMDQIPIPPEAMAFIGALGIVALVVPIVLYIFGAVMLFLIAGKTSTSPAWLAFIPIANVFLMVLIAGKPIWWLALLLLPVLSPLFGMLASVDPTGGIIPLALSGITVLVSMAAWLFICLGIAQARGKSVIWGVLLFIPCTNPIGLGYLGLSR